jgi:hypothetical protein
MTLALGILVFAMLAAAGPPICDSGCIARAEDARPALKKSDFLRIPAAREIVPSQYESLMHQVRRQAAEEYNPNVERESRRKFRRGDFWPQKDFDRAFQDLDRGFRPGR